LKRISVMVIGDRLRFASAAARLFACRGNLDDSRSALPRAHALAGTGSERSDLMSIDVTKPGMTGLALAGFIRAHEASPEIEMMRIEDDDAHCGGAVAAGPDAFPAKGDFARGFLTWSMCCSASPRSGLDR
jgi:DNA-binding NarL/FixJ family response regulator